MVFSRIALSSTSILQLHTQRESAEANVFRERLADDDLGIDSFGTRRSFRNLATPHQPRPKTNMSFLSQSFSPRPGSQAPEDDLDPFDENYAKYCDLKVNVHKVQVDVESVLRKLKEFHEALAQLSNTVTDVYKDDPQASEFAGAFGACVDDAVHGYTDHLARCVESAVLQPLRTYEAELDKIDRRVQKFHRAKEGYSYYSRKVNRLTERYQRASSMRGSLEAAATNAETAEKTLSRLNRSSDKLKVETEKFNHTYDSAMKEMNKALDEVHLHFDPAFARMVDFLAMVHVEEMQHMFRAKSSVDPLRKRCEYLVEQNAAEEPADDSVPAPEFFFDGFISTKSMKHMQGFLQLKGKLMMRQVFVILEGPNLKVFNANDSANAEWQEAKNVYTVVGSTEWDDFEETGLTVVTKAHGSLFFVAPNPALAGKWMRALISCITFDHAKSRSAIEQRVESTVRFMDHCSSYVGMKDGTSYQDAAARMASKVNSSGTELEVSSADNNRLSISSLGLQTDYDSEADGDREIYASDTSSDVDGIAVNIEKINFSEGQEALAADSPHRQASFDFDDPRVPTISVTADPVPLQIKKEFDALRGSHELLTFDRALASDEVREIVDSDAMELETCRTLWEDVDSKDGEKFTVEEFYTFVKSCEVHAKLADYQRETNLPLAPGVHQI